MKKYLLILSLLLNVTTAAAQTAAEIRGHVTDERNASINGAEVRLIPRTGRAIVATTNANGDFTFTNVLTDDFVLEIKASGFASVALPIAVARGQSVTKNVTLSVEAVNETVTVTPSGTT